MARRRSAATGRPPRPGAGPVDAGDRALLVTPGSGGAMSRLQRTFNGLVQDVAALESRLSTGRDDLEALLECWQKRVAGPDRALGEAQFALARALASAQSRLQLRSNAKKDLAATVCSLCEDAFLVAVPTPEMEALYEEWAGRNWREAFRRDADEDDASGQHSNGDPQRGGSRPGGHPGEDASTPNDEDFTQQDDDPADEDDASRGSGRARRGAHRTADFVAREERRAKQAELARRSVREVYLALARVLHPDAVADPAERQVREEAMKAATSAYRQGDLLALLRLELQWLRREDDVRKSPADDTLRAYIRALREQVARLQDALVAQADDPRYDPIAGIAFLPRSRAMKELVARARQLRAATAELVELRAMVLRCESRAELASIVRGARLDRGE